MELQQIQIRYVIDEDRIQFKFRFLDVSAEFPRQEILMWISRRLSQRFWPVLLQAMTKQQTLQTPEAAAYSADLVQMGQQASMQQLQEDGGLGVPYQDDAQHWPLGKESVLLKAIHIHVARDQHLRLEFDTMNGASFEIGLGSTILHAFCSMLQNAVREADWGFHLQMPGAVPPPVHLLN